MTDPNPSSSADVAIKTEAVDEDLDAELQGDIDMANTGAGAGAGPGAAPGGMNFDGPGDSADVPGVGGVGLGLGAGLPTKKDASLREFLGKMEDFAPIIPDAVTNYYLTLAGLPPPPHTSPQLARLLALATQKFIADIAADAYQYSRIRSSNTSSNNPMGALGAATGFPAAGQGAPGGGGAAGGAAGKEGGAQAQGKGGPLGVQRPGFGGGGQGGGQGRTVLTMEDLGMAVGEYGVNVKRGEFYR